MNSDVRELRLHKGKDCFVFRYQLGHEAAMIEAFNALARDPASSFDWFDAAFFNYLVLRHKESELEVGLGNAEL